MTGYVRLANLKGNRDYGPELDEVVIRIDRQHPCLGNKHYLKNRDDLNQRARVIELFQHDIDLDERTNGLMSQAVLEIALRVIAGEKIVLMCWCTPLACHGDIIIDRVRKKVREITA